MNVSLVLVRDDGKQTEVPLRKATQVVGRQTDCAVRLPNPSVSRHHCEVTVGDGRTMIRDLGSSNGTFVNRKRVTQLDLSAGDLISIGEFVFVVRVDGEPVEIDAEEAYDDGIVIPAAAAPTSASPAAVQRPVPASTPKPAPKPASKSDEDSLDDSSVADFDFLDEDEDLKKQPKL
jgi:pSer/pThr/pTyr-binding forkhead associated (FHA) protein